MGWTIEFDAGVEKDLKKLGAPAQREIIQYLKERIVAKGQPCSFGKPLRGSLSGLWRYRVGNYRVICKIEHEKLVVLVIKVGHRKNIY